MTRAEKIELALRQAHGNMPGTAMGKMFCDIADAMIRKGPPVTEVEKVGRALLDISNGAEKTDNLLSD